MKVKTSQRIRELRDIKISDVQDDYDYIISGDLGCVFIQKKTVVDTTEDDGGYEPMDDIEWREEMEDRQEQAYLDSFSER